MVRVNGFLKGYVGEWVMEVILNFGKIVGLMVIWYLCRFDLNVYSISLASNLAVLRRWGIGLMVNGTGISHGDKIYLEGKLVWKRICIGG